MNMLQLLHAARAAVGSFGPAGEVVTGGLSVRVVGAEHSQLVSHQLPERGYGARQVPGLSPEESEVAAGGQGVGVVGAEHPQLVSQQLLVGGGALSAKLS
jgi:hypothetical protein